MGRTPRPRGKYPTPHHQPHLVPCLIAWVGRQAAMREGQACGTHPRSVPKDLLLLFGMGARTRWCSCSGGIPANQRNTAPPPRQVHPYPLISAAHGTVCGGCVVGGQQRACVCGGVWGRAGSGGTLGTPALTCPHSAMLMKEHGKVHRTGDLHAGTASPDRPVRHRRAGCGRTDGHEMLPAQPPGGQAAH